MADIRAKSNLEYMFESRSISSIIEDRQGRNHSSFRTQERDSSDLKNKRPILFLPGLGNLLRKENN